MAIVALAAAIGLVARGFGASAGTYAQRPLVSDVGLKAPYHDATLVNTWGLAASPTGPWWTTNEARGTSSLYSGDGRKQLLTVAVPGGPTGIAYYGGDAFLVRGGGRSDPARFVYACEDGNIRAWTPTVPDNWSTKAESSSSTTPARARSSAASRSRTAGCTRPTSTTPASTSSTATGSA